MLVNNAINFNKPNATNALTAPTPNASAEILSSRGVVVKSPSSFDTFLPRSNCFITFRSTRSNISYYDVSLHSCSHACGPSLLSTRPSFHGHSSGSKGTRVHEARASEGGSVKWHPHETESV